MAGRNSWTQTLGKSTGGTTVEEGFGSNLDEWDLAES